MYTVYQRIADRLATLGGSYVGDPPNAASLPYLFVWGPFPAKRGITLAGTGRIVRATLHVTCVAASPADALKLAADAEEQLSGWQPHVPGWHTEPIQVRGSTPLQSSQQHTEPSTGRIPEAVVLSLRVRASKTGGPET